MRAFELRRRCRAWCGSIRAGTRRRARFVEAGLRPHPRRHRPPAVPAVSRDSVPPLPPARPDRDRVHRRALDHADRVRLRPRAGRALVSAAHRDADRRLHRLHGAREHRRRATCARAGSSRSRSASCTGSASRSRSEQRCSSRGRTCVTSLLSFNVGVELGQLLVLALLVPVAGAAVPRRRRRADGNDHPVGARRAHRRGTG